MELFRFGIMGAGKIAVRFCDAVEKMQNCMVAAVASKSGERAGEFADKHNIEKAYGSYEQMLREEALDGVYIAVTPNDHFRLSMLCLEHGVAVLCEKAMFQSGEEARIVFAEAKRKQVFVMEAMWSRFMPALNKVKQWVEDGRIGKPEIVQAAIGFVAPGGEEGRYYNRELGGGVARDITVYAYELTTYILNQKIEKEMIFADWSETGVDIMNHIVLDFEYTHADLLTSFQAPIEERMVLYGMGGKIVLPKPHVPSECFLYAKDGSLIEHYKDEVTSNGFTYEIDETIRCVREGRTESMVVPHSTTIACAELFDRIEETRK